MNALLLTLALLGHPTVTDTAILGHGDPTPRFAANYANVLSVPAGQTVTLPPDSTYDAIEVAGTLTASQEHDTVCRTIHLTVLPGGVLDLDTPKRCEIVWRDVPLRTGTVQAPDIDPMQIGNGLLVFGMFRVRGHQMDSPWTQLTAEAQAGATALQFAVPGGWQVGDELLLPDMRQPAANIPTRRESPVRITAINGNTVTLDKPLDFEHHAVRRPDGSIVCLPYVANITRNIVFRSENPAGTRGHVIFLEQAKVDVQYAAFLGMGRTQATNLDSTSLTGSADDRIGTNQIARYGASHWHHVHGHADIDGLTGRYVGVYADGMDGAKWGFVQHGSHDIEHRDCIADRFVGAGFVTEDGYEVRGHWTGNLACYSKGNGIDGKFNLVAPRNIPGGEGAAFWFHGMGDMEISGNVACCSAVGYQFLYRNQVTGLSVPSVPGGPNNTPLDPRQAVPAVLADNVAVANRTGFEQWNNPTLPHTRPIALHNSLGIKAGNGEPGSITATDVRILQTAGDATSTSAAYTGGLAITGGEIITPGSAIIEVRGLLSLKDVTIQAGTGLNYHFFRPERTVLDGVLFKTYPGKPADYIVLGHQPINEQYIPAFKPNDGKRFIARNWQRQGQDYLIFEEPSLRSKPALAKAGKFWSPVAGKTSGEVWDSHGVGYYGGVIADADAVPLPGLIYGVGKAGLDYPLGPPRAVVYSPSALAPTVPLANGLVRVTLLQTGSDQTSRLRIPVQADGGTIHRIGLTQGLPDSERLANLPLPTTEGSHEIVTWREDASGNEIAGSRLVSTYYVGEPTPEEPPPPPEPTIEELKAMLAECKAAGLAKDAVIAELKQRLADIKELATVPE